MTATGKPYNSMRTKPFQNGRELPWCPAHQIGYLTISNFNNSQLTVGSLDHIHRIKWGAQPASTFVDDLRNLSGCRLGHRIQNEIAPLRTRKKILNPPGAKAALNCTAKAVHIRDHPGRLFWFGYAGAGGSFQG